MFKSCPRGIPREVKGLLPPPLQQENLYKVVCGEPETEGGSGSQTKLHCPGQMFHFPVSETVRKHPRGLCKVKSLARRREQTLLATVPVSMNLLSSDFLHLLLL